MKNTVYTIFLFCLITQLFKCSPPAKENINYYGGIDNFEIEIGDSLLNHNLNFFIDTVKEIFERKLIIEVIISCDSIGGKEIYLSEFLNLSELTEVPNHYAYMDGYPVFFYTNGQKLFSFPHKYCSIIENIGKEYLFHDGYDSIKNKSSPPITYTPIYYEIKLPSSLESTFPTKQAGDGGTPKDR